MKHTLKIFGLLISIPLCFLVLVYFLWYKPKFNSYSPKNTFGYSEKDGSYNHNTLMRISSKGKNLEQYAAVGGFNTEYCFLIDMQISSGSKRFFVYNLEKDSIELAGLVAHGSGRGIRSSTPVFSNMPNSNCTSLGKYKVGKSYQGKFGLAYKLYGLDPTNSNAFNRFVVLHAHECVPYDEVNPVSICKSWGCPTVSPAFLQQLNTYINKSQYPILMWIYN